MANTVICCKPIHSKPKIFYAILCALIYFVTDLNDNAILINTPSSHERASFEDYFICTAHPNASSFKTSLSVGIQ